MTKTTNLVDALQGEHTGACPANRIEVEERETPDHEQLYTVHCQDCGAHVAVNLDGTKRPQPTAFGPFANGPKPWGDGVIFDRAPANGPARRPQR